MIDMKQAVQTALDFVRGLYEKDKLTDFLLEEVELSGDEKHWLITVGFNIGQVQTTGPYSLLGAGSTTTRPERAYKVITIDAESGKALSLKIKKI